MIFKLVACIFESFLQIDAPIFQRLQFHDWGRCSLDCPARFGIMGLHTVCGTASSLSLARKADESNSLNLVK